MESAAVWHGGGWTAAACILLLVPNLVNKALAAFLVLYEG